MLALSGMNAGYGRAPVLHDIDMSVGKGETVAVLGPNGCGKSNIVDAIKWVLGEQSAKSLRGKDMADVIFKGALGRKLMNTAEATIIFDNQEGRLPVDAAEGPLLLGDGDRPRPMADVFSVIRRALG